jgi:hypothetical protein
MQNIHPIDAIDAHLLRCTHINECTKTHDAIHDTLLPLHKMFISMG